MRKSAKKVFLAANSAEGFISYFGESYNIYGDFKVYILKGGPGTGKSSFMKYMSKKAEEKGLDYILCPCTSDPDSLDGLIIPSIKTVFLDGTAPHTVEPILPGACEEIINLGAFWETDRIRENKAKILETQSKNKFCHKTAARYMAAAGQMLTDNLKISRNAAKLNKLDSFSEKLAKKYITKKGEKGEKTNCFLSGITPNGIISFKNSVTENFKRIIVIEDKFGFIASEILRKISAYSLLEGYKTVIMKNPFLPSEITDHILIPELSLAFVTENDYIKWETDERKIHSRRFLDPQKLKAQRGRTFFNRRVGKSLIASACYSLKEAKMLHDILEKYYINSMNFTALNEFTERLADKIFK